MGLLSFIQVNKALGPDCNSSSKKSQGVGHRRDHVVPGHRLLALHSHSEPTQIVTKLLEHILDARQGPAPGRGLCEVGGHGPWDWQLIPARVRTCGGQSAEVAGASCDDFQVVSVPGPEERGHAELGRNRCNGGSQQCSDSGQPAGGARGVFAWVTRISWHSACLPGYTSRSYYPSQPLRRLKPRTGFPMGKSDLEVDPQLRTKRR